MKIGNVESKMLFPKNDKLEHNCVYVYGEYNYKMKELKNYFESDSRIRTFIRVQDFRQIEKETININNQDITLLLFIETNWNILQDLPKNLLKSTIAVTNKIESVDKIRSFGISKVILEENAIGNGPAIYSEIGLKTKFDFFVVRRREDLVVVWPTEINIIEAKGAYSIIHRENEEQLVCSKPIGFYNSILEKNPSMIRLTRSIIVNLDNLKTVNLKSDTISTKDGSLYKVGIRGKKSLYKLLGENT